MHWGGDTTRFYLAMITTRKNKQANMVPRGDSNPYDLRRYHLKVVRLPIPPPGLTLRDHPYKRSVF